MLAEGLSETEPNALILCMGGDFGRLPPLVQRAHRGNIRLEGNVTVTRGAGFGGRIAALVGLPDTNPECPLIVNGRHLPDRMIWQRDFAGWKMESRFTRSGHHLIETMGNLELRLRPECAGECLHYRLAAVRWHGLPLPSWVAPTLIAWEGEVDGFYEFEVDIGLPLVGRLVRYAGRLQLVKGG